RSGPAGVGLDEVGAAPRGPGARPFPARRVHRRRRCRVSRHPAAAYLGGPFHGAGGSVMTELALRGPGNGRPTGQVDDAAEAVQALRPVVAHALAQAAGGVAPAARAAAVDELITWALDGYARQAMRANRTPLDPATEADVRRVLRDELVGLGGLQP